MCDFSTEGVKGLLLEVDMERNEGRVGVEQAAEIRSRRRLVVGEEEEAGAALHKNGDDEAIGLLSTSLRA
jgi:hypothetical protein